MESPTSEAVTHSKWGSKKHWDARELLKGWHVDVQVLLKLTVLILKRCKNNNVGQLSVL